MKTGLKRGLVLGMSLCLAAASLAGCGKKEELDTAATIAALDGENVTAGVANFLLRYQQTQFESSYGGWLKSYYGDNLWNMDLMGTGELYGDTFKNEIMTELERMLLAEKHMADYSVELTDEEKTAITEAAKTFISENEEEVLEKMSATQENVERVMTLYTIRNKMEHSMSADVDTEVSDEEAAQRTVSYVRFDKKEESEEAAEDETAGTDGEADTENPTEEGSEADGEAASEEGTEAGSEKTAEESTEVNTDTEAALTEVESTKTETADTEAPETDSEAASEESTETDSEAVSEESTEVSSEAVSEESTEEETEDEATRLAKEEAKARAEAFLAEAKEAEDFAEAAAAVTEKDSDSSTSSYTFGDDDTYPDEAIIAATKDLADNTLVEEVVEVNDSYYVLHVDDSFDEEAVAEKKDQIVAERKLEAINALYEEWTEASEFTVDEKVLGQLVFDMSLTIETEAATEQETAAEEETEITTEVTTEPAEADAEVETEAGTEADTETESEKEA